MLPSGLFSGSVSVSEKKIKKKDLGMMAHNLFASHLCKYPTMAEKKLLKFYGCFHMPYRTKV